jgi:enolase
VILRRSARPATSAGEDVCSGSTCASEFFDNGKYHLVGEGKRLTPSSSSTSSPTGAPVPDRHHRGRHGRGRLGRLEAADRRASASKVQLVGDDLFVTNPKIFREGIEPRASPTRS